jgi:integrase
LVTEAVSTKKRRPKGTGSVRERSKGRWQLRAFAGKDPVTGRARLAERTVSARNETEARKLLRDFQHETEAAGKPSTGATVRVVVEEWLRHSEARGRSPRTVHEARRCADTAIFPVLGDIPVRDLEVRQIDEWWHQLAAGPDGLAPASVRRYCAVLRAALQQAVTWGWLDTNPAEKASLPELKQRALQVPTTAEVQLLLEAAWAANENWGMLLALALLTGARRGELCALRWPDVEGGTVRIRRSLYRAGEERGEKGTKGGRERWVQQAPVTEALLAQWREQCEARAQEAGVELVPDAFVVSIFPDGSRPVNPDSLSSAVHRLCKALGMPHVHLHSIRHYAATELLAAGVDARNAAEVLGHRDPSLTLEVYAHGTAERQQLAAEVLGRVLIPPESPAAIHGESEEAP